MPEIQTQPEIIVRPTPLETAGKVVDNIRSTITDRKKLGLITASAGLAFLTACSGGEIGKQRSPFSESRPGYTVTGALESRREAAQQRIEERRATTASKQEARKEKLASKDRQKTQVETNSQTLQQPEFSTNLSSVSEESHEEKLRTQLKKEIDERFGIELLEGSIGWEAQHIEQLQRILSSFPEQLYQTPPDTNAKLVLSLTTEGGACCRIISDRGAEVKKASVAVAKDFFDKGEGIARSVLAHELTHYLEKKDSLFLPEDLQTARYATARSPLTEGINNIFEGKFYEVLSSLRKNLYEQYNISGGKFDEAIALIQPHNQTELQRKNLYNRISYMLSPSEFLAVCSEQYVMGKKRFFRVLGVVFEEEKVEQLYDFTKREIFQGREY